MHCSTCHTPHDSGTTHCSACGSPLTPSLTLRPLSTEAAGVSASLGEGTTLDNDIFIIEGVLGRGGFGITYRGRDRQLGRTVAIKEFFPSGCVREGADVRPMSDVPLQDYASARQHFLDEAQVLARFHHPGIVQVYTVFEENNTAYMVMEFLHGQTLAALLETETLGLGQERSLALIGKIAPALAAVHDKGLLHRDIKPDNIVIAFDEATQTERVVLIDFGSARELGGGQTRGQSIVLTPGYAPLEQYAGQTRRGAYSDVYALAATLYYMLTGQIPTAAGDRAVGVPLPPVQRLNPRVTWPVADAVHRAMEIEIARRPQTVRDFMAALFSDGKNGAVHSFSGDALANASHDSARGGDLLYPRRLETLDATGDNSVTTLTLNSPTKNVTKPIGSILRSVALSQPPEPHQSGPTLRLPSRLKTAGDEASGDEASGDEVGPVIHKGDHSFLPNSTMGWSISVAASLVLVSLVLLTISGHNMLDVFRWIASIIG